VNQWLTLVANLGVIAGIVFLGFEIQQNSDAINAQTYQSRAEAAQELSATIMDSEHFAPLLAKLDSGLFPRDAAVLAELNPEDKIRIAAFHQWLRVGLDNQLYQYEHGFIDEEFFNGVTKPSMALMTPAWEELQVVQSASPAFRRAIAPYRKETEN
jgi:hypothetical protein